VKPMKNLAMILYTSYGMDFRGYVAVARVLLSGRNPYAYSLVASHGDRIETESVFSRHSSTIIS